MIPKHPSTTRIYFKSGWFWSISHCTPPWSWMMYWSQTKRRLKVLWFTNSSTTHMWSQRLLMSTDSIFRQVIYLILGLPFHFSKELLSIMATDKVTTLMDHTWIKCILYNLLPTFRIQWCECQTYNRLKVIIVGTWAPNARLVRTTYQW